MLGVPHIQGPCDCTVDHLSPNALCWVEEVHLLPPLTEEHLTLMGTPLLVRSWATSIDAGATEGVGRGSSWCL